MFQNIIEEIRIERSFWLTQNCTRYSFRHTESYILHSLPLPTAEIPKALSVLADLPGQFIYTESPSVRSAAPVISHLAHCSYSLSTACPASRVHFFLSHKHPRLHIPPPACFYFEKIYFVNLHGQFFTSAVVISFQNLGFCFSKCGSCPK